MARSVLFIGGTGVISSACVERARDQGWQVSVLNRGRGSRPLPDGVEPLVADIRDRDSVTAALQGRSFDAVCEFVGFLPDHVTSDIELFTGRAGQYVFISSASAYQTPAARLPITEATPLRNPYWKYSRNKIACEDALVRAYREDGFPVTIVRPSHTYDRTLSPLDGGATMLHRLVEGREVVVHGDGSSLWTLTHNTDFAKGLVGLLGLPAAVGGAFHITNDEWLTWDAIVGMLAAAAGSEPRIVHVPSDAIAAADPQWGAGLLGDKANSSIFDNSLIRSLVPDFVCTTSFAQGAREIIEWHTAEESRLVPDPEREALIERLVAAHRV